MPKRWLANTLPAPATWLITPSKTRRPCPSSFIPSSRKWRRKRPLCETPKASAWRMPVPSRRSPAAIIGFAAPLRSVASVTQKRDEIAHRGKADAEHLGAGRLVPQLVNFERRKAATGWEEADRFRVGEFPSIGGDLATGIALAVAHGQPRMPSVGRDGRVGKPHDLAR